MVSLDFKDVKCPLWNFSACNHILWYMALQK